MGTQADDAAFDQALVSAACAELAEHGWHRLSVVAAARRADLPLDRARARFPGRLAVLGRLGRMADQAALAAAPAEGSVRDRLFDQLMRRIDVLGAHRTGVLALLRALPTDPPLALFLGCATRRSMRWMLEAAGVSGSGLRGELRVKGLVAVWLWTLRAWQGDESADLAATMAALDGALTRAERAAGWLGGGARHSQPEAAPDVDPNAAAAPATDAPPSPSDPPGH